MSLRFGAIWVLGTLLPLVGASREAGVAQLVPAPSEAEEASRLLAKARERVENATLEQALAPLEELLQRFGQATQPQVRGPVLEALKFKGELLVEEQDGAKALLSDEAFAERYVKDMEDFFLKAAQLSCNSIGLTADPYLADSMLQDAKSLAEAGRNRMALLELEDLLQRFPDDDSQAEALAHKSRILAQQKRWPEALATCDQLTARFEGAGNLPAQKFVFEALFRKAEGLNEGGRAELSILVYDAILKHWQAVYGQAPQPLPAKALQLKGSRLLELGRKPEGVLALEASFRYRGVPEGLTALQQRWPRTSPQTAGTTRIATS